MHLVWFSSTSKELYYMRCDFTSSSATAIRLYTDITNIMETVFVGSSVGTIAGLSYIKQAYSVGWTNDLKKGGTTFVDIDSSHTQGIVLPTLREETCLAPTVLTKTITMTVISGSDISQGESTEDFEGTKIDNGDTDTDETYFNVILDTRSDL